MNYKLNIPNDVMFNTILNSHYITVFYSKQIGKIVLNKN